jgi:hypothetical protein
MRGRLPPDADAWMLATSPLPSQVAPRRFGCRACRVARHAPTSSRLHGLPGRLPLGPTASQRAQPRCGLHGQAGAVRRARSTGPRWEPSTVAPILARSTCPTRARAPRGPAPPVRHARAQRGPAGEPRRARGLHGPSSPVRCAPRAQLPVSDAARAPRPQQASLEARGAAPAQFPCPTRARSTGPAVMPRRAGLHRAPNSLCPTRARCTGPAGEPGGAWARRAPSSPVRRARHVNARPAPWRWGIHRS